MDMLFLIPLAMTAILYVAMWYFRIGSNKMKERNVKDRCRGTPHTRSRGRADCAR